MITIVSTGVDGGGAKLIILSMVRVLIILVALFQIFHIIIGDYFNVPFLMSDLVSLRFITKAIWHLRDNLPSEG